MRAVVSQCIIPHPTAFDASPGKTYDSIVNSIRKHYRLAAVAAFGLFYLTFWYLAQDILDDDREITEDNREEQSEEIRDIDVSLIIIGTGMQQSFRHHLTTNETIGDLLEMLYESGELSYEQRAYTYGTEIVEVNGVQSSESYRWVTYHGDSLVQDFTRYKLTDDGIYTIHLELMSK